MDKEALEAFYVDVISDPRCVIFGVDALMFEANTHKIVALYVKETNLKAPPMLRRKSRKVHEYTVHLVA